MTAPRKTTEDLLADAQKIIREKNSMIVDQAKTIKRLTESG